MTTNPSSDVLERLRLVDISWSETGELCAEAAATIERLSAERFDDVVAAYRAGAQAVHDHWAEHSDEVAAEGNIGGPDFTEAAHDYARAALSNTAENG